MTGSTLVIFRDVRGHEDDTPAPGIHQHRSRGIPGRSGIRTSRILRFCFPELRIVEVSTVGGGSAEGNSFVVSCEPQKEVDYEWDALSEGGREGRCGWLDDRFGAVWRMIPANIGKLMGRDPRRVMEVLFAMGKIETEALRRAGVHG